MTRQNDLSIRGIVWLFSLTYMVSYITRINYGSVISEMVSQTGFSRSLLAMALTGSSVTYGLGQIVSGVLGDRFSPKKLVAAGLGTTVCMNLLIPLCPGPGGMLIVWSINGFAQSFMWPPIVRLMSGLLSPEDYDRAVVRVSWGSSVGTVLIYLTAPVMISLFSWKGVFFCSALCGAAMLPLWLLLCPDTAVLRTAARKKVPISQSGLFSWVMLGVMVCILLQGALRDGVTTWMPSYIAQTYRLSNRAAILTGVVMPLFSIASFQAATVLYHRHFPNPILCAGVIFLFGAASALALYLVTGSSPLWSVLFSALLTGAMHGVNLILVCMVPNFFSRYGSVATVSGIMNSCTYAGSALSSYGIALISELLGWNVTVALWAALAAAGAGICFCCVRGWNRKFG